MLATFLIIVGLVTLVVGAEMILRSSTVLAASMGIRPIVIGLTVVSVGTSIPELIIGITAVQQGSGTLAVANIAGTNLVNILFILGLSAILRPLPIDMKIIRVELPMIVLAAGLMTYMSLDGSLSRLEGVFLNFVGILYTIGIIRASRTESRAAKEKRRKDATPEESAELSAKSRLLYFLVLVGGIAVCIAGADWLVDGAVGVARALDVSESIIGLTIVAVGTSAPELVTTIVSTLKGARDVAVGNLIGSSIYNILIILGLTCLAASEIPVEKEVILFDIPLMAFVAVACVPVFITGKSISRLEGVMGVTLYVAYMSWLVFVRS